MEQGDAKRAQIEGNQGAGAGVDSGGLNSAGPVSRGVRLYVEYEISCQALFWPSSRHPGCLNLPHVGMRPSIVGRRNYAGDLLAQGRDWTRTL